jgi:hypothetical protein
MGNEISCTLCVADGKVVPRGARAGKERPVAGVRFQETLRQQQHSTLSSPPASCAQQGQDWQEKERRDAEKEARESQDRELRERERREREERERAAEEERHERVKQQWREGQQKSTPDSSSSSKPNLRWRRPSVGSLRCLRGRFLPHSSALAPVLSPAAWTTDN